ncbi:ImmA/IrrE family metallo-endopeptidase [Lacticaseibacillus porcinae]|uniref:ImmA/IrrE family metallo-endopeptidase n=1 Tax=Lacticaseibacillus porcinae TaxID=1123687 RepID=UPI000F7AE8A7|nr:ImmA/IrrE family metallo-endopeptidase [Lacticaseibacillus porcinae]
MRHNFDLAHELGHLVLHTQVDFEALSAPDYKMIEKQAHQFASAFLLPEREFRDDYALIRRHSNPDSYVALKQKYQVSIVAMAMRAYALGLMSYQEYRYFFGRLNKLGYKNQEPLDDELVPVRPGRIRSLIKLLFDHHVLTVDDLTQRLNILPAFVVKLFALDEDFFEPYMNTKLVFYHADNVIPLHPKS